MAHLAYIDSMAGLIPCEAIALEIVAQNQPGRDRVTIRVRSPRAKALGFQTGEDWPARRILPRSAVTGRRIRGYDWRAIFEESAR